MEFPGHRNAAVLSSTRARGIAIAFGTAFVSGVAVFVNGYAVKHFDSATTYTTAKNAVTAVLLAAFAVSLISARPPKQATERLPRSRARWAGLVVVGIIGGSVPFVLFFEGLARASSTQAAFIHKTLIIWVVLLAVPFLRERLTPIHLAAIGLLLFGQVSLVGSFGTVTFGVGELMIFLATLCWAVEVIVVKRLLRVHWSPVLAVGRMGVGVAILLTYLVLSGRGDALLGLSTDQWSWALLTGLILTAYVSTWYAALARAPAIDVTAVLVLGAVITALLNRGFKGVPVDAVGLAFIVAGVVLIGLMAFRRAALHEERR